jgi:hypothetical protein
MGSDAGICMGMGMGTSMGMGILGMGKGAGTDGVDVGTSMDMGMGMGKGVGMGLGVGVGTGMGCSWVTGGDACTPWSWSTGLSSARRIRARSRGSCTPARSSAWMRCRRCSRPMASRARLVFTRGEPACTSPYMALLAELHHSCTMVSHVTHVNVSCRRARSSLSKRLALPDGSTKKVMACRPEFVCRIIRRGCAGLCRRAASMSIGMAISPCLAQQSVRNAHQCGTWMSPPIHHGANWAVVSSPLRVALRAAARVHCGRPPIWPVLRASPARFAHPATGASGIAVVGVGGSIVVSAVAGVVTGGGVLVSIALTGGGVLVSKARVGLAPGVGGITAAGVDGGAVVGVVVSAVAGSGVLIGRACVGVYRAAGGVSGVAGGGVPVGSACVRVCGTAGGVGGKAGAGVACRAPALVRLPRLGCTNKVRALLWLRRQVVMISREVQAGDGVGGAMVM